ncbi:MAG: prolyl oligopeptidase family serine peptidase [Phycisphaera sp.]|nr:prolyl oligopeptidase family serine peptidase [Phycisphaera sp.]
MASTAARAADAPANDAPLAAAHPEIKVWPNGAPGEPAFDKAKADAMRAKNDAERIYFVDDPTLTWYPAPADTANGACVVICPGGGYHHLAWAKEGLEIADWLNTLGVSAAVLKYRVPRRSGDSIPLGPLQDVQRAVRLVRANAERWRVDTHRVGVLGFSAGGHLTVMAGTHYDDKTYDPVDDADKLSAKPDFLLPIYPAYLNAADKPFTLHENVKVTKDTPPTFLAVAWDDQDRGAMAALLFVELKKNNVPAEVHVYTKGGHGYGMRPSANPVHTWPDRAADWLGSMGLLKKSN